MFHANLILQIVMMFPQNGLASISISGAAWRSLASERLSNNVRSAGGDDMVYA
jgi:hypothetical protein